MHFLPAMSSCVKHSTLTQRSPVMQEEWTMSFPATHQPYTRDAPPRIVPAPPLFVSPAAIAKGDQPTPHQPLILALRNGPEQGIHLNFQKISTLDDYLQRTSKGMGVACGVGGEGHSKRQTKLFVARKAGHGRSCWLVTRSPAALSHSDCTKKSGGRSTCHHNLFLPLMVEGELAEHEIGRASCASCAPCEP